MMIKLHKFGGLENGKSQPNPMVVTRPPTSSAAVAVTISVTVTIAIAITIPVCPLGCLRFLVWCPKKHRMWGPNAIILPFGHGFQHLHWPTSPTISIAVYLGVVYHCGSIRWFLQWTFAAKIRNDGRRAKVMKPEYPWYPRVVHDQSWPPLKLLECWHKETRPATSWSQSLPFGRLVMGQNQTVPRTYPTK